MATSKASAKTYTITLQGKIADDAAARASRENRTMSELVGDALRFYAEDQPFKSFDEIAQYAANRNPHGYNEADVPRLIREVREELNNEPGEKPAAAK